jgi:hypothetical protein
MFTLNNIRINIYAPHTDANGTRYGNLTDPAIREALGVVEVADPTPPDEYLTHPQRWFRVEQDDAPYVVYTRKSDEQIAEMERPVVPQAVSRFQARAALSQAGLFITVDTYMATLPAGDLMRLAWQDAQEFRRDSPTVAALAVMLQLDDAALDALFITAAGITA